MSASPRDPSAELAASHPGRQPRAGGALRGAIVAIATLLAVLAAALSGCAAPTQTFSGPGSIVDGFPVGEPLGRPEPDLEQIAVAALDAREPGHAAVVDGQAFLEDLHNESIFHGQTVGRSGTFTVVVFTLADGSVRATGVHCHPGGCDGYENYPH